MQYTPHYNLNLPEGTDIVNPLVQDNPNYSAIDTALYDNKLRVIGTATHVKTGTNHAITLGDSDIVQFKFVATGDYASGDTFTVDGVTVTARIADGSSIPSGAFKINSTVLCILDGAILNFIGIDGVVDAGDVTFDNSGTPYQSTDAENVIKEIGDYYYIGAQTGTTPIALPATFKELYVIVGLSADMYSDKTQFVIPYDAINSSGTTRNRLDFKAAYSAGAFSIYEAVVDITNRSSINILDVSQIGTGGVNGVTGTSHIWVYYR